MQWNDRFSWSGETPTNYPGLNPKALQRITPGVGKLYPDSVTPTRMWERKSDGALDGNSNGNFGLTCSMNGVNPATEKGNFMLPYFAGLWPSSGKLLVGLWLRETHSMGFSPYLSTRGGTSPLVYLSSATSGRLRHQVYSATGTAILDQYEDPPWAGTQELQYVGMLLDMDARTSQLFSVEYSTKRKFIGPVRTVSGAPNPASTANVDIFSLQNSNYWTTGNFDEMLVAHPGASFDLAKFVDDMALGLWADGQRGTNRTVYEVSETSIKALQQRGLLTGAERVSWTSQPVIQGLPAGGSAHWSSDEGATWSTGALPAPFTGILRWEVPLAANQTFSGITLTEPVDPPPVLDPIPAQTLEQGEVVEVPISFSLTGSPVWRVSGSSLVAASIIDSKLVISSGFSLGTTQVEVTLVDEIGREATQLVSITVVARNWEPSEIPNYPHSPVIIWDQTSPQRVLFDPTDLKVKKEINGGETVTMQIPAKHKLSSLIRAEYKITVAGEDYIVRRIETRRSGRKVIKEIYAEALFFDLATKTRIKALDFKGTTAGDAMAKALAGTGWRVGAASVDTLRTYSVSDTNPLELLREIQRNHGGDLVFDNKNKTVSLVPQSGRDKGVGFFYGKNLTESRRVEDTTSLITRIYPVNEDGLTISSLNGGVPYLENFSFTSEVKEASYKFKSGTSALTMLDSTRALLAKRATPDYSYEVTVSDLSARSKSDLDKFDVGDRVLVVDQEVGIQETQRIVALEYDVLNPTNTQITLSAKLRELGDSDVEDAGTLTSGGQISTFDLVPYNLLLNGRFDNQLAHWAHFGVDVVSAGGTGDWGARFTGSGSRWLEQTVAVDNREAYALSFDLDVNGPSGWVPDLKVEAEITYEDGTTEVIKLDLS